MLMKNDPPKWYQRRNQGKWLMGSRCEQVPWSSRWQLPYCASSPVPTCATPLSTLPIHWMPFGRPAAPLGQESIWSSWATYHHASIGRPPAHHGDTTCPYCSALVAQNCHFCSAAQMQNRLLGCMLNCCPTAPSSSLKQNYNQVIISQLWTKNESIQRRFVPKQNPDYR